MVRQETKFFMVYSPQDKKFVRINFSDPNRRPIPKVKHQKVSSYTLKQNIEEKDFSIP